MEDSAGGEEYERPADLQDFLDYKDAVIYVIDVRPSMLVESEDDYSPVYAALLGAYMAITDRLMFSPLDMSGVLLRGVSSGNVDRVPGLYELVPLGLPDSRSLKLLKTVLQDPREFARIVGDGSADRPSLADALFYANQQYTRSAPRYFSRRLVLVSDEDEPHRGDPAAQKAAKTRAADLVQLNVRIKPLLVQTESVGPIDTTKFYDDLALVPPTLAGEFDEESEVLVPIAPADVVQECSLTSRSVRRKAEFTSTVELGPDVRFGVKGYLTLLHRRPQRSHWVYNRGEESKLVHTESQPVNTASGRIVDKEEIRRGYKFGDRLITLTPDQHERIREIDAPVIRIVGFKPLEAVRPRYNLTHPRLIYPTDTQLAGSVRAFACLHQAMLKKRRAAIAWCVLRANNTPRLCALLPVREDVRQPARGPYAGKQVQHTPDGFYLIQLPFRDDIREPPLTATKRAPTQDLVDALDGIIDGVQMGEGYTPERYANKQLEDFNRILQAKALEEELPEHFKDNTVPSYKSINKRVGEKIESFNKLLDEVARLDIAKRPPPPSTEASSQQQPKTKTRKRDVSETDIIAAAKNGTLERYTRDQLRAFATAKNIDYGHKKAEAVEAVKNFVNSM
ncbi:hypothetical protein TRICI_001700 [Trichomonascus ciferrii]|uniref:ATP-dependent DNA helicase II subunit 1 n=1 Tax=Trichomonascus ciferrii TaxID=44093 RepID=A0A642V8L3_9ASCO|nr:hypothetical protein TRICI_001700 [Trichomonascus ciferrii]